MKILYLFCHPLPESFHAAIRDEALAVLKAAGHEVDLLDLYAEGFDPVLSEAGRRRYHDTAVNQQGLEPFIARLRAAEALVVQFPTWSFGPPAMLKGFFDRMFMPGVGFDISNPAAVRPLLTHIRSITGIVTYGRPFWYALWMGDPPKRIVMRYLWWFTGWKAKRRYLALYHLNIATADKRASFVEKVKATMAKL